MKLKYYRMTDRVFDPIFATPGSACFDLKAYFGPDARKVTVYTKTNERIEKHCGKLDIHDEFCLIADPGDRMVIPTGLIFDIPEGHSIRIHPRSGLSLKVGMVLANQEAVIDADYREQTYILLKNDSTERVKIFHGDRICQGELIQNLKYDIERTDTRPETVEGRDGGMGSTGK